MSLPGRPKGEYRSAKHGACLMSEPTRAPASVTELFLTFSALALQSFGGALALLERSLVQRKRWLSRSDFLGLFAIGQVLPGPSGIALCVLVGDRFFGLRGALAALAGFLLVPAVVVLSVASVFLQYQHLPPVQGALNGMGAASAGLIIMMAVRMATALRGRRVGMAVAAMSAAAIAVFRWPVAWVVLSLGAASVAWAWYELGRAAQAEAAAQPPPKPGDKTGPEP